MSKSNIKMEALFIIADFSLSNDINKMFKKIDLPFSLQIHGTGSAKSAIFDLLGYGGPKKLVSISLQTKEISDYVLEKTQKIIDFNKAGTGIAFTVSLSSISSLISNLSLKYGEKLKAGSDIMPMSSKAGHHLIITIINSGYFENIMEAAKRAGATGGTLLHAKGTGSKEAEKYLGITIQPEKDLVLILATDEKRLEIMESIIQEVGARSECNGICFSMPVNGVLGTHTGIKNFDHLK